MGCDLPLLGKGEAHNGRMHTSVGGPIHIGLCQLVDQIFSALSLPEERMGVFWHARGRIPEGLLSSKGDPAL